MSNVLIGITTQKGSAHGGAFLADKLVYLVYLANLANLVNLANLANLVNLR